MLRFPTIAIIRTSLIYLRFEWSSLSKSFVFTLNLRVRLLIFISAISQKCVKLARQSAHWPPTTVRLPDWPIPIQSNPSEPSSFGFRKRRRIHKTVNCTAASPSPFAAVAATCNPRIRIRIWILIPISASNAKLYVCKCIYICTYAISYYERYAAKGFPRAALYQRENLLAAHAHCCTITQRPGFPIPARVPIAILDTR